MIGTKQNNFSKIMEEHLGMEKSAVTATDHSQQTATERICGSISVPYVPPKCNPMGANTTATTYRGGCGGCGKNISYS